MAQQLPDAASVRARTAGMDLAAVGRERNDGSDGEVPVARM